MGGFIGFKRFRVWWWRLTPQFFKFLKSTSLSSLVHHDLDLDPGPDLDPDPDPNPDPDLDPDPAPDLARGVPPIYISLSL